MAFTPEICPQCGAELPLKAKACPQCGSDEKTGWSDEARTDELGLPNPDFDYNEFVKREFGGGVKPRGLHWFWWLVGLLLLIAIVIVCVK
jgi:hypothetical protein